MVEGDSRLLPREQNMPPYQERFPIGARVKIADRTVLQDFRRTWKYHTKLTAEQLDYADHTTDVESAGFYHGGDVLYKLRDVPGIWHEQCLCQVLC